MENINNLEAGERGKRVFNIQIYSVDENSGKNVGSVTLPVYANHSNFPTKEELREFIKNMINNPPGGKG